MDPRNGGVFPGVLQVERQSFLTRRWVYQGGEHVTVLAPTNAGKTMLVQQLLEQSATPSLPAVVLVTKPRDATVTRWAKSAGYHTVRDWPPPPSLRRVRSKPPGFILWPKTTYDPLVDDDWHHDVFRRGILDGYKRGRRITVADEAYSLSEELRLRRELITVWTKGRSMDDGLWAASQRPAYLPLWAYSMAEHLFIAFDPDKKARERYDEIGGIDPGMVRSIVARLPRWHWLYIRRSDRTMCIVGP